MELWFNVRLWEICNVEELKSFKNLKEMLKDFKDLKDFIEIILLWKNLKVYIIKEVDVNIFKVKSNEDCIFSFIFVKFRFFLSFLFEKKEFV